MIHPPIVRIEVQHMKHAILHAFSEHLMSMDADMRAAVEYQCQPERIAEVIRQAADKEIREAIETEIRHFYSFGPGRQAVKDAVAVALEERAERMKKWDSPTA